MLVRGKTYTRADIWNHYHPGEAFKNGGNWRSGYVRVGNELVIFMNIGVAGRTGHDFDNRVNEKAGSIQWYGKPKTHSGQEIFQKLISRELTPRFFARWNDNKLPFKYLGEGYIDDWVDGAPIVTPDGKKSFAIKCFLTLYQREEETAPSRAQSSNRLTGNQTALRLRQIENSDGSATVKTRKEQSILREYLLRKRSKASCDLCEREFPATFLVAAHIKKRSLCTYEERTNTAVGMLACKYGCDELYEKHYIFVDNEGIIHRDTSKPTTKAMKELLDLLDGKQCNIWSPENKQFFDAHRGSKNK